MRCLKCSSDRSSVVDSRGDGDAIRRRRECQSCGFRFTTYERVELPLPMVVKKDGRRETFDHSKLRAGILKACEKRPVSIEHIDAMVEIVERKLHALFAKEVPSRQIGDYLMEELHKVDTIAYVRFASVYREFSDVNEFVDTLEKLRSEKREEPVLTTAQSSKAANEG